MDRHSNSDEAKRMKTPADARCDADLHHAELHHAELHDEELHDEELPAEELHEEEEASGEEADELDCVDDDGAVGEVKRPHLISVDELRAAGALDVPPSWRKSLAPVKVERPK